MMSSGSFSFLSGIFTWTTSFFETNATTIGAVCTAVSLCFMIFFGFANGRKLDKSADNSNRLNVVDEHIEEMKKDLTSQLDDIKNALRTKGESDEKTTKRNKTTKL